MADAPDEHPECGHEVIWGYEGGVAINDDNGISIDLGLSASGLSVQLSKGIEDMWGRVTSNTADYSPQLNIINDPDEKHRLACGEKSCDFYYEKVEKRYEIDIMDEFSEQKKDVDVQNRVNTAFGYGTPRSQSYEFVIEANKPTSLNPTDRDDEHDIDSQRITVNPAEPIGDPHQHLHANGNTVSLDASTQESEPSLDDENEHDSDQTTQAQPNSTSQTTDEAIENEESERDSSEAETATTEAIEADEQRTAANTPDEPVTEQNAATPDNHAGPTVQATPDENIQLSRDNGDISLLLGEQTDGTAITVSPQTVDDMNLSFSMTDVTVAFAGTNDGGTIHIAPGNEAMTPAFGDGMTMSGRNGEIQVSPGTAGELDVSFGADSDYQLSFDASQGLDEPSIEREDAPAHDSDTGPTASQEREPDNAHDTEPTTAHDNESDNAVSEPQQTANGQGTGPDTAQSNQDTTASVDATERDTETGPGSNSTESDLPEETEVSEGSTQDKRKHRLENVLASNGAESELSEETEVSGRSTQDNRTHDVDNLAEPTEQETDREDHAAATGHDEEHDDSENESEQEIGW